MTLLSKLGDAILDRFVPQAEAHACVVSCGSGCDSYVEAACIGGVVYYRCCYLANGTNCAAPYCDDYAQSCGESC